MTTIIYFKIDEKQKRENQDEQMSTALEDDFDSDSERLEKFYAHFKRHETYLGRFNDAYDDAGR